MAVKDAFNPTHHWTAASYLATGLLWKGFMSIPEIQGGLQKLGFESPYVKQKN